MPWMIRSHRGWEGVIPPRLYKNDGRNRNRTQNSPSLWEFHITDPSTPTILPSRWIPEVKISGLEENVDRHGDLFNKFGQTGTWGWALSSCNPSLSPAQGGEEICEQQIHCKQWRQWSLLQEDGWGGLWGRQGSCFLLFLFFRLCSGLREAG